MIILILSLLIVSAIAKAIMDKIQFHYDKSIFSKKQNKMWWDPTISWKNKYKYFDPTQGPRFFGSTTFLVFLTDAWHFFQMIHLTSIEIIISMMLLTIVGTPLWSIFLIFIVVKFIRGAIFELFFSIIFEQKKN